MQANSVLNVNTSGYKLSDIGYKAIDIIIVISSFLLYLMNDYNKFITGFLLIFLSLYVVFKCRNNNLFLISLIIAYVNVCIANTDIINSGIGVSSWQTSGLRNTEFDFISANNLVIFYSIINIFIPKNIKRDLCFSKKDNNVLYIGLLILSILLLLYGGYYYIKNIMGEGYTSSGNTTYEYIPLLLLAAWFFSGNIKIKEIFLLVFTCIYTIIPLFFGDRSASILGFLLIYYLFLIKRVKKITILISFIAFIFIFNFIGIYRNGSLSFENVLLMAFSRGLYSDTISYSYYTGITFAAIRNNNLPFGQYYLNHLLSILLGSRVENSNLANISYSYYNHCYGGIISSHFYGYFGFFGVIFGACLVGIVLRYFFNKDDNLHTFISVLIACYSFRWYVYGPLYLFRSCIFIPLLLYLFCYIFYCILERKRVDFF